MGESLREQARAIAHKAAFETESCVWDDEIRDVADAVLDFLLTRPIGGHLSDGGTELGADMLIADRLPLSDAFHRGVPTCNVSVFPCFEVRLHAPILADEENLG